MKRNKLKKTPLNWKNVPDDVLCVDTMREQPNGLRAYLPIPRAPSLSPDTDTMWGCLQGHPLSLAIIDAWAFRAPVVFE